MLSFAAPAFLFGLLALPVVVWLHRLRVRRERRVWAGTFLWRRAREQGRTRPRFLRTLLLLLQLLAVTALVLAAAQPRWNAPGPPLRVLVIDASAGMAATDGASSEAARERDDVVAGATRTDVAFAVARELAAEGGPIAVVRGGLEPRLALAPTDDGAALDALASAWTAGDAGSDRERALVLARDVAAAHDGPAELHWLADRPPPSAAGVHLHPLAGEGRNVGVTGFERIAGQAWVRVSSTWPQPLEVPLELLRDGTVVASTTLVVPARGDAATSLPVGDGPGGPSPLQARIVPPEGDVLDLDDVAWAPSDEVTVLLDRPFDALERALFAVPGVRVRVVAASAARSLPADLRVLHDPSFGPAPEGATLLLPERTGPAVAVRTWRWDRTDPLLRFVDLRDLIVAVPDPAPLDEGVDWTTAVHGLVDGDEDAAPVPLLQRRERDEGAVVRLAFHPARGDLTLRPAFPTLVVNLLDEVRGRQRVRLGEALPDDATGDGVVRAADGTGAGVARALRPGPLRTGDRVWLASLLDEETTRLAGPEAFPAELARTPSAAPAAGEAAAEAEGAAADGEVDGAPMDAEFDLVPWLLALAVLLLLAEWWGHAHGFRRPSAPRLPRFGRGGRDPG